MLAGIFGDAYSGCGVEGEPSSTLGAVDLIIADITVVGAAGLIRLAGVAGVRVGAGLAVRDALEREGGEGKEKEGEKGRSFHDYILRK